MWYLSYISLSAMQFAPNPFSDSRSFRLLAAIVLFAAVPAVAAAQAVGEELKPEVGPYKAIPGGFQMNLRIVDNHFRLYFVDEEMKVVAPVFKQAYVTYEPIGRSADEERIGLTASGPFLSSPRFIRPPYAYWVRLLLAHETDDEKNIVFGRLRVDHEEPAEIAEEGDSD